MMDRNVEWLNIQYLMDWARFESNSTLDMDFCSTALFCHDEKGANMAMEV